MALLGPRNSLPDPIPPMVEHANSPSRAEDPAHLEAPAERTVPLAVDLDGTLIATDSLLESVFILAKTKPLHLLMLPVWLAQGIARLKRRLAEAFRPDIHTLPYDREFVAYLETEKRGGRTLILATGANETLATAVAAELGVFDAVIAGDGVTNLTAHGKRDRLVAEFGEKGFDYAGHGGSDRVVWNAARKAILVRPTDRLRDAQARISEIDRVFPERAPSLNVYSHALRIHHWTKNLLVFVPMVVAHRPYTLAALAHATLAFFAFCLCASSVYLLNDLMDLPDDRRHPHKRHRMLASGQLPVIQALVLIPLLLAAAFMISLTQPPSFLGVLALYCGLMFAYCLRLRGFAVVDALAVATGYSLRVVGGAVAVGLAISTWLIVFCVLFFFGLTLLKRYAELVMMHQLPGAGKHARAYLVQDRNRIALFGCSSGYIALIVFAFFSEFDQRNHPRHEMLWIVCGLLLYWVTHMWLLAGRGKITGDPVAFTLRDRPSWVVGVLVAIAVMVGS